MELAKFTPIGEISSLIFVSLNSFPTTYPHTFSGLKFALKQSVI